MKERQVADGSGGEGDGRGAESYDRQESLDIFKSFNTLCDRYNVLLGSLGHVFVADLARASTVHRSCFFIIYDF